MKYRDNKTCIVSMVFMLCLYASNAAKFGFRVCTKAVDRLGTSTPSDYTILYYQYQQRRYTCKIPTAPNYDTKYVCDTDSIGSADYCAGSDFIQFDHTNPGKDDLCISAIIVNGQEISVKPQRLGNHVNDVSNGSPDQSEGIKEVYKRKYTVYNGKAVMSRPAGFGNGALVPVECYAAQKSLDAVKKESQTADAALGEKVDQVKSSLTSSINDAKSALEKADSALDKRVGALEKLEAMLSSNELEIESIQEELSSLSSSIPATIAEKLKPVTAQINMVKADLQKTSSALTNKVDNVTDAYQQADSALDKRVDAASSNKNKVNYMNDKIAAMEKYLDEIGGSFAAQSAAMDVSPMDVSPMDRDYPTQNVFGDSQDLIIICLVIFNIGTVLGCFSCLYWTKKNQGQVQVFDDLEK